jgi:predicted CoA-binding protein
MIPVNPRENEILGIKSWPSLSDVPVPVDTVDVFRHPDAVPDIAREALSIGASCLWLQYGVISEEGVEIALAGGMDPVVDRCMKVEHARYFGRMHWLGFNTGRITALRTTEN